MEKYNNMTLKSEEAQKKKALKAEEAQKKKALKAEEAQKKKALKAEEAQKKKALKAEEAEKKKALKAEEAQKKKALKAEEAQKKKALKAEEAEKKKVINRGTGAGGANTNINGKLFEEKTDSLKQNEINGFITHKYGVSKTTENKTVVIVKQRNFSMYVKENYKITNEIYRHPDEAYIIEYTSGRKIIKIIEKKNQNVDGSVETKLLAGPMLKREYEKMLGSDFEIYYCYCISKFLQKKITSTTQKYNNMREILEEENKIPILFGDDDNYFEMLELWVNSE